MTRLADKPTQAQRTRHMLVDGREIVAHGNGRDFWQDFYHSSLSASWSKFFLFAALCFVALNVLFATVYMLDSTGIANLQPKNLLGAFFFSVETLATVGYGDMHPQSLFTHFVATVEVFIGTASVAVLTGLIFARFSKPTTRILFSDVLVLSHFNGRPTLMLRTANARQNLIANATARMHVVKRETTLEGKPFRRVYDLSLARDDQPIFFLSWTIMHPITPSSPLYGMSAQDMQDAEVIFLLRIVGFDESIAQDVQVRKRYYHDDIQWGHYFADTVHIDEADGTTHIDYSKFHDTEPAAPAPTT